MKKDIVDNLIKYELGHLDQILDYLSKLKLLDLNATPGESAAWNWFESNPSRAEKKKVLKMLGYDVSKL